MKQQQTTALVLCTLLLSTFAHDILNAHHQNQERLGKHHESRHHESEHHQGRHHISQNRARPSPPSQHCIWVCQSPSPTLVPSTSPGLQTQPPTPGLPTKVPTLGPQTQPPTPGPQTQPPTPGPKTQPPTPGPQTQPPTPGPRTQPPTPGPKTQPPTPGPKTQPPTLPPVSHSTPKQVVSTPPPHGCLNGSLSVVINATSGIIGAWNKTAQVGIAFDLSLSLVAVFNGSSGAVVIINVKTQQGIWIAAGASAQLWLASKVSFDVFINGLASLQVVWNIGLKVGKSFSVSSASQVVLVEVASILVSISASFSLQLSGSASGSLTLLVNLGLQVVGLFGAQASAFLSILVSASGSVVVSLQGDIQRLLGLLGGVVRLVGLVEGGVAAVVAAKIRLDLAIILAAASGAEVLAHVVKVITVRLGAAAFGAVFASGSVFLSVVVQLGGGVVVGVGGALNVLAQLLAVLQSGASAEVLIQVLIEFVVNVQGQGSLSAQFSAAIQALLTQVQNLNAGASASAIIVLLQNLRDNKLTISGVDVSGILRILLEAGARGVVALNVVVQILLKLSARVQAAIVLPQLLLVILSQLSSRAGLLIIVRLIPNLGIDADSLANGNFDVFAYIKSRVNILSLLVGIVDVVSFLKRLPVVGNILVAISASVQASGSGSSSFEVILKSGGAASVVTQLSTFLSGVFSIKITFGGSWHIGKHLEHHGHHEAARHHHAGEKEHHIEHQGHHIGEKHHLEHHQLGEKHHGHEHEREHHLQH